MKTPKTFMQIFAEARQKESFWVEGVILDFTAELERLMKRQGMTNTKLSERLGTSKAYITKVFRGNANFTLQTMVKLSRAVGGNLHIHIADQEAQVHWFDSYDWNRKPVVRHQATVTEEIYHPQQPTEGWGKLLKMKQEVKGIDIGGEDRSHAA